MINFFFPKLISSPTRLKIFKDLISTSLPPGRYTDFFFRLSPDEPTIKKYLEVEKDVMGRQLVDVEGKIVCILCGRKYKQTGINKHRRACMKYHQDKNILFDES